MVENPFHFNVMGQVNKLVVVDERFLLLFSKLLTHTRGRLECGQQHNVSLFECMSMENIFVIWLNVSFAKSI
jgi:hypothetical protein